MHKAPKLEFKMSLFNKSRDERRSAYTTSELITTKIAFLLICVKKTWCSRDVKAIKLIYEKI